MLSKDAGLDPSTAPNGVYIEHVNGKLFTADMWDTAWNDEANGVAVITNKVRIVIAPTEVALAWASNGNDNVWGVTDAVSREAAIKDFNGIANTQAIVKLYGNNGLAGAYCHNYVFKNKQTGYLGAAGEWDNIKSRMEAINKCMKLINSAIVGTVYHSIWSSTEWPYANAWYYDTETKFVSDTSKTTNLAVRPFTTLGGA